jgi:hypothetical protein
LLLEGEAAVGEGDVVIGGKESDQGDHGAGGGFQQALAIEAQKRSRRGCGQGRDRGRRGRGRSRKGLGERA